MPNKALVFNIIGIILQYSVLILIYYFLVKVIQVIAQDLRTPGKPVAVKQRGSSQATEKQGKLFVVHKGEVPLRSDQFMLGDGISIGRSEHNEVSIEDAFVSHEHAVINKSRQGYWLTDLNSTNKTYLNNQPVTTEKLLKNGDLIKIGAVTFRFEG